MRKPGSMVLINLRLFGAICQHGNVDLCLNSFQCYNVISLMATSMKTIKIFIWSF
jgi:hypothetical protein